MKCFLWVPLLNICQLFNHAFVVSILYTKLLTKIRHFFFRYDWKPIQNFDLRPFKKLTVSNLTNIQGLFFKFNCISVRVVLRTDS